MAEWRNKKPQDYGVGVRILVIITGVGAYLFVATVGEGPDSWIRVTSKAVGLALTMGVLFFRPSARSDDSADNDLTEVGFEVMRL